MKNICIIDQSNFYDNPVGGSTTFLRTIIPALSKYYKIHLIGGSNNDSLLHKWTSNYLGFASFYGIGKIDQHSLFIPNRLRTILNFYRCRHEIIKKEFELLYFHQTETVLPFIHLKGTKKVLHMHGLANPLSVSRFTFLRLPVFRIIFNTIMRIIEHNLSLLLSVSRRNPNDPNELKITRTDIFKYVPVCINSDLFAPSDKAMAKKRLNIDTDCYVFGFVGRLNKKKGIAKGLQIVQRFNDLGKKVCFLIIGDGEHGVELRSLCKEMEIENHVRFLSARQYDELPNYYNAMDVFLMGSEAEGFPMVILEALSCGVPVISTNVGAISEIIVNGVNGFVTGHDYVGEACSHVEEILSRYAEMSSNARHSVTPYRANIVAQQVSSLLNKVFEEVI